METRPFLRNLNGLRFLAASYTIFFHYWSFPTSKFFSNFFMHGHISVPFFFLLSGFVLSYSYQNYNFFEGKNYKKYILSRFIRLAPIYYISMALAIPLLIHSQFKDPLTLFDNFLYSITHIAMIQSLFPFKKLITFWNIHSWSLSVEMFLYLCSPILIFKACSFNSKKIYFSITVLLVLNSLIYLFLSPVFEPFNKISTYFAPLYLVTFFNGVVLAKLFIEKRKSIEKLSSPLFIISSLVLTFSFFANFDKDFYSPFNPFFHIGFSALILGSCTENKFNRFLGGKSFFFLGEISYAMYILQAPVKLATQQFLGKIVGYKQVDGLVYCISIYLSIIIGATALSVFIDPHARKLLRRKFLNH